MSLITFFCLLFSHLQNASGLSADITVDTLDGPVLGYTLNIQGTQTVSGAVDGINVFLGIPYAEPPTDTLRFARPVPKSPWKPNPYNATRFSAACPQEISFLREYGFYDAMLWELNNLEDFSVIFKYVTCCLHSCTLSPHWKVVYTCYP